MIYRGIITALPDEIVCEYIIQGVRSPDLCAAVQHSAPCHQVLHAAWLLPRVQLVDLLVQTSDI